MLSLDEEKSLWIQLELRGYPSKQIGGIDFDDEESRKFLMPNYRWIELPARGPKPAYMYKPMDSSLYNQIKQANIRIQLPFLVHHPCGLLEAAKKPIPLSITFLVDDQYGFKKIARTLVANLPVSMMRGIIGAIEARIGQFVSFHLIALEFGESIGGIIDETRDLIANRLELIGSELLKELDDTIVKQSASTSAIEWRGVLESCRTILRRFTGLLLHDFMIPEGVAKPRESNVMKKLKLMLDWAQSSMKTSTGTETEHITKDLTRLHSHVSSLLDIINKPIHGEIDEITKGDVDLIIMHLIVWMADLISLLDRANYPWQKPDSSSKS